MTTAILIMFCVVAMSSSLLVCITKQLGAGVRLQSTNARAISSKVKTMLHDIHIFIHAYSVCVCVCVCVCVNVRMYVSMFVLKNHCITQVHMNIGLSVGGVGGVDCLYV